VFRSIIVNENYQVAVFQEVCPASQSQTVWQHFSLKDSVSALSIRPNFCDKSRKRQSKKTQATPCPVQQTALMDGTD
jgi:hypothetical protein